MNEQGLGLVPMVVEQSARGERAYDIYSRLLKERADAGELPKTAVQKILYENAKTFYGL